jgi:hypothetical protein
LLDIKSARSLSWQAGFGSIEESTVRIGKHLLIGMIALLMLCGDLSLSAAAFGHKHRQLPKSHGQTHYKTGPYADLVGGKHKAPKKQHVAKHSHYNR